MEDIFSKTLITGGNGMVGDYVDFGIKTDRTSLDITNLEEVIKVCKKYKPKIILHLAAETNVDKCEREPQHAYYINTIGTYNMLLGAKAVKAKFVYVSTAGVFDGKKKRPYTEKDIPNPQSHYARSKFLGEVLTQSLAKDYLIVRTGWIFGGGPKKDHKFVGKIISLLPKGELAIVKDTTGTPTYGKDLIAGVKRLIRARKKGIIHVGNKGYGNRYDMAKVIVQELSPKVKIKPVSSAAFNLDVKRVSSEAMKVALPFMRPWEEALREYLHEWK